MNKTFCLIIFTLLVISLYSVGVDVWGLATNILDAYSVLMVLCYLFFKKK